MSDLRTRETVYSFIRHSLILLMFLLLQSCVSPASKLDQLADSQGFERSQLMVGGYRLLVYRNQPARALQAASSMPGKGGILHVYLEGDGSPWRHRTIIMADPTPRRPLMLGLMKQDKQPAAYLGRPCYNGTASDKGCDPTLWTSGRYSQAVIDSMSAGLRVLASRHKVRELWLMGHSGGGALAMLLARELSMVTRVVTIAGNLDIDAWTLHHGYTPLYGSVNPAQMAPLRAEVWQWHLLGGRDAVIPPTLIRRFIMQQRQSSAFVVEQFGHGCCWQLLWPTILDALDQDDPGLIPARQFKFRDALTEASESR